MYTEGSTERHKLEIIFVASVLIIKNLLTNTPIPDSIKIKVEKYGTNRVYYMNRIIVNEQHSKEA